MKPVLVLVVLGFPLLALGELVVVRDTVDTYVRIRATPSGDSEVIGELHPGDRVLLTRSMPGWHEVAIPNGRTGFVTQRWTDVVAGSADDQAYTVALNDEPAAAEAPSEVIEPGQPPEQETPAGRAVAAAPSEVREPEPAVETLAAEAPSENGEAAPEAGEASASESAEEHAAAEPAREDRAVSEIEDAGREPGLPKELLVEEPAAEIAATKTAGRRDAPDAIIEGTENFLTKFTGPTTGGNSQIFDDGINVGIGTTDPEQPLDVNGNIQIHARNSEFAALMLTQMGGDTGYIVHNLANTLTIGSGSEDRITINRDGNIGIGTNRPRHPLEMASGAHVTAGGVWTNASSREYKENIEELTLEDALAALGELAPVRFNYKTDGEDDYVGFIAEDVPDLVATKDRRGLSAMDLVAVLTKVVQAQQKQIEELESRLGP